MELASPGHILNVPQQPSDITRHMDFYTPPEDEAELVKIMADYLAQAQSPTLDERRAGVEGLYELACKLGSRVAKSIPVLVEALCESDDKLGESASWALAYCAPDSVEPLIACLAHPGAHVREVCACARQHRRPCSRRCTSFAAAPGRRRADRPQPRRLGAGDDSRHRLVHFDRLDFHG